MTTRDQGWDGVYSGTPPWDIGRPQPAFARLAEGGLLSGQLLDAGCGTGENALLAAAHGAEVVGIDLSPRAIERARAKAADRGLPVRFEAGDVLHLGRLGRTFDTVIDSGVFHVFDDEDRPRYVASLASVLKPGGRCYLMCFSDRQPGTWGPRRVRREELTGSFGDGWSVVSIEPDEFEVNPAAADPGILGTPGGPDSPAVQAWLGIFQRA
jgi:SAM-dependent methyltransferase